MSCQTAKTSYYYLLNKCILLEIKSCSYYDKFLTNNSLFISECEKIAVTLQAVTMS